MSKSLVWAVSAVLVIVLSIRLLVLGFPLPDSLAPILLFLLGFLIVRTTVNEIERGVIFPMDIHREESPGKFYLSILAGLIMGAIPIVFSFILVFGGFISQEG